MKNAFTFVRAQYQTRTDNRRERDSTVAHVHANAHAHHHDLVVGRTGISSQLPIRERMTSVRAIPATIRELSRRNTSINLTTHFMSTSDARIFQSINSACVD